MIVSDVAEHYPFLVSSETCLGHSLASPDEEKDKEKIIRIPVACCTLHSCKVSSMTAVSRDRAAV